MAPSGQSVPFPPVSPISSPCEGDRGGRFNFTYKRLEMGTSSTTTAAETSTVSKAEQHIKDIGTDAEDMLFCDLSSKALSVEDLENALRLWTRPAVLIACRNALDRLPPNIPATVLFLDLSWNRLTSLDGFAALHSLRELDVSHNGLYNTLGLVSNTDLRVLRIAYNRVRRIEGLEQLRRLEQVDLSHNLLRSSTDVRALSLNAALRYLRMEGNPFCTVGVSGGGSFEVCMQHLLPGVTLSRNLSPSSFPPPPPPPSGSIAKAHHHHHHHHHRNSGSHVERHTGSPPITFTRDGVAFSGLRGDLSVSRGWRDSPFVTHSKSLLGGEHNKPQPRSRSVDSARRVPGSGGTTGGGGPAAPRGSYVHMHLVSKLKGSSNTTSACTPAAAAVNNSREKNNDRRSGEREHTGAGGHAPVAPGDARQGVAVSGECGGGDFDKMGFGVCTARGGNFDPPASVGSYNGRSRAERAAARRLVWSQARQEGHVGSAAGRRTLRRKETNGTIGSRGASRKIGNVGTEGEGRRARGPRVGRQAARRGEKPSSSTFRAHPPSKSLHDRSSAEGLHVHTNQVNPARNRSRRGQETVNSSTLDSRYQGSRQAGVRERVRGSGNDKAGAKGLVHSRPGTEIGRRWNESRVGSGRARGRGDGRRPGGGVTGVVASADRVSRDKKPAHESREMYNYKTSLGQRSRRTPRPEAPLASKWTPREDAAPRWEGNGCRGGGRQKANDGVERLGKRLFKPDGPVRRPEGGKGGADCRTSGDEGCGDGQASGFSYVRVSDDNSVGSSGREHSIGQRTRHPFVSPLSPAGILQRAVTARTAATSKANITGPPHTWSEHGTRSMHHMHVNARCRTGTIFTENVQAGVGECSSGSLDLHGMAADTPAPPLPPHEALRQHSIWEDPASEPTSYRTPRTNSGTWDGIPSTATNPLRCFFPITVLPNAERTQCVTSTGNGSSNTGSTKGGRESDREPEARGQGRQIRKAHPTVKELLGYPAERWDSTLDTEFSEGSERADLRFLQGIPHQHKTQTIDRNSFDQPTADILVAQSEEGIVKLGVDTTMTVAGCQLGNQIGMTHDTDRTVDSDDSVTDRSDIDDVDTPHKFDQACHAGEVVGTSNKAESGRRQHGITPTRGGSGYGETGARDGWAMEQSADAGLENDVMDMLASMMGSATGAPTTTGTLEVPTGRE